MSETFEACMKFRFGRFEGWLVGPMRWEVRTPDGHVWRIARNMSECSRAAQSLYDSEKAAS